MYDYCYVYRCTLDHPLTIQLLDKEGNPITLIEKFDGILRNRAQLTAESYISKNYSANRTPSTITSEDPAAESTPTVPLAKRKESRTKPSADTNSTPTRAKVPETCAKLLQVNH